MIGTTMDQETFAWLRGICITQSCRIILHHLAGLVLIIENLNGLFQGSNGPGLKRGQMVEVCDTFIFDMLQSGGQPSYSQ